MKTRFPLLLSAALLATLAACDRTPPPPAESENYSEAVAEEVENTPDPLPAEPIAPEPVNIPEPVAEAPPPPEPVLPDEQMIEDAEATGMTARVNRGGDTDEDNSPAEDAEQK